MADRVIVTNPVVGICHMQVCCVPDATDEEILQVANRSNPSGTSGGWSRVIRDDGGKDAPVRCESDPSRIHLLLSC